MATIPLGRYAQPNVRSQVGNGSAPVASDGRAQAAAGLAGAIQGASNLAQNIAEQNYQQDQMLARAKAANASAEYGLQVNAAYADVADQLKRGADYTKAGELYDNAIRDIPMPEVQGLNPSTQEQFNGALRMAQQQGRLKVASAATSARRDDGQRQFSTAIDLSGKIAGQPGADVEAVNSRLRSLEETYVNGFGLDRSATSKAIQNRIDGNWTNQAAARFNTGHDDIASLRQLEADLTTNEGYYADKLDAEKRNAMALKVGSRIDALQAKAERDAAKVDNTAQRALDQIDRQVASGVPGTMEQWSAWSETFKAASPEMKQEFQNRIDDEKEVQAVLRAPIAQQQAVVAAKNATMMTQGASVREQANIKRLSTAVEANVKMLTNDPLQYLAAREGEQIQPIDLQAMADPSQQGAIAAQLEQRATLIDGLRKTKGGQVKTRLLMPNEAEALSTLMKNQTPSQQADMFGHLRTLAGNDSSYKAIMAQITPDNPVLSLAGMIYAEQRNQVINSGGLFHSATTATAGDVARTILAGNALVNKPAIAKETDGKPSAFPMPKNTEFDADFASAVGTTFAGRPGALEVAKQAVRAYYAGKSSEKGDLTGELDTKRLQESVRAVLGTPVDYGSTEVFPPWGMDEDTFRSKMDQAWLAVELPDGFPTDIDEYGLMNRSGSSYYVVDNGSFVIDANGNPVTVDLNNIPDQNEKARKRQEQSGLGQGPDTSRMPSGQELMQNWKGGARGL